MLLAAALLQELVSPAQSEAGIKLEFLERAKGDDGSSKIDSLLDLLKAQDGANVGTLPKVDCPIAKPVEATHKLSTKYIVLKA